MSSLKVYPVDGADLHAHLALLVDEKCSPVTFPGKGMACLICLARTKLCPGKVLNILALWCNLIPAVL